jgi:hypothetical protein
MKLVLDLTILPDFSHGDARMKWHSTVNGPHAVSYILWLLRKYYKKAL